MRPSLRKNGGKSVRMRARDNANLRWPCLAQDVRDKDSVCIRPKNENKEKHWCTSEIHNEQNLHDYDFGVSHGRRAAEQAGQKQLREQLGQVPSNYLFNSTLRVTPMLDQHSESMSTSTRCRSDSNMLTVPKQQPHRRDLPIVFEGNKPEQQSGSMTTFRDWAAEVQIYMSLENHNLATVMDE
eukprot:6481983-Amphidinium_carterae.1